MSGWTVLIVMLATAGAGAGSWMFTPKGPNQTVIRSSTVLTLACCYIMWAIVYMSQLHPLIKPQRSDVRHLEN